MCDHWIFQGRTSQPNIVILPMKDASHVHVYLYVCFVYMGYMRSDIIAHTILISVV